MAFKPFDEETLTAIQQLKELKPDLNKSLESRITFLVLLFRYDLYSELMNNQLLNDYGIGDRDWDICLGQGDSDLVVHGLIKQALEDHIIKFTISCTTETMWDAWYYTYEDVERSQAA